MRIVRTTLLGLAGLGAAGWLLAAASAGTSAAGADRQMPMTGMGMMTTDQKIANAMSAAPPAISAKATILDWPAKEGAQPTVIRAGSNGWNCLPDAPNTEGNDPMCVDRAWMQWIEGYTAKKAPRITSIGIGYMIAGGGAWGSNTEPFAMSKTADNQWHMHPPHLMIVVPDPKVFEGLPTDPSNGGPYVMWAGTPYAHIMAPITAAGMMDHQMMMGK